MKTTKFKPSEVGPIPEEWEVKRLGDVCDKIRNGYGYDFREHGTYPMSRIETISSGEINYSRVALIEDEPPPEYRLRPGDILYSHINSLPYIGNIAQYDGSGCLYHGMNLLLVRPANTVDSVYLKYILKSEPMRNLARSAAKVAINQASISTKELAQFQIVLPPRPAQEKIAEALSDVDGLLAAMTKLIEKKHAIKQGAMQQLLTGKKRLAGFTGKWVEKRIGDMAEVATGATPSTLCPEFWGGDIRWMSSGELNDKIVSEVMGRITKAGFDACSTHMVPVGCVLIGLAGQGKTRGTAAYNLVELCTNQSIAAILPNASFDSRFLYYYMDRQYEELRLLSAGDGGRGGLTKGQIENFFVTIPPTNVEQHAISIVLSDMDTEIMALEAKRSKFEQIKQGMMQELLTGNTRFS